ncbi:MAG: SLC13 family permease [Candidatus Marsarchaeota archaeon]|nr:SLC13 family permease [Candidatus Marsarchaeota archaeon]
MPQNAIAFVKKNLLFFVLLAAYLAFVAYNRDFLNPALVEWKTVTIIASLIIINTGMLASGGIDIIAKAILGRIKDFRKLAIFSILFTVLLSMFITNDASLIVLIPLTMSIGKISGEDIKNIIVLQAIGANVGSMLTPFGNPQNIIIFREYGLSLSMFVLKMLPVFLISVVMLLIFVFLLNKKGKIAGSGAAVGYSRTLFSASLLIFAVTITGFLYDSGVSFFFVMAVLGIAVMLVFRLKSYSKTAVLLRIDFLLILTFVLIFLVINSARTFIGVISSSNPLAMFVYSLIISQFISNVPATVLLQKNAMFLPLSWGVNVGGNGTVIASLANLIALRGGNGIKALRFMKISLIYMAAVALISMLLLYIIFNVV